MVSDTKKDIDKLLKAKEFGGASTDTRIITECALTRLERSFPAYIMPVSKCHNMDKDFETLGKWAKFSIDMNDVSWTMAALTKMLKLLDFEQCDGDL